MNFKANPHNHFKEKHGWHGGPWDRGVADSYYRRAPSPHKYPNGTAREPRVVLTDDEEIQAYWAGYDDNERYGDHKDWGS